MTQASKVDKTEVAARISMYANMEAKYQQVKDIDKAVNALFENYPYSPDINGRLRDLSSDIRDIKALMETEKMEFGKGVMNAIDNSK